MPLKKREQRLFQQPQSRRTAMIPPPRPSILFGADPFRRRGLRPSTGSGLGLSEVEGLRRPAKIQDFGVAPRR